MITFMMIVSLINGDTVHTHYDSQYKSYDECKSALTYKKKMSVAVELREHIKDGTKMTFICMPSSNYVDQRNMAIVLARSTETVI